MSRWGKNVVVPLDTLLKEKENTNRPTAARSAGTVGRWGKMGFTSTRTYALQCLPATITSGKTPETAGSTEDASVSPTHEPPKPKKFFKSRNSTLAPIRTQFIQHLPRAPPSPIHETIPIIKSSPQKESIKVKLPKPTTLERKKSVTDPTPKASKKDKKPKVEKKIKPEAPPSRIISRSRKVVNYNEDEEDSTQKTVKDSRKPSLSSEHVEHDSLSKSLNSSTSPDFPAPITIATSPSVISQTKQQPVADHPPIVLRISKGTSRLVSTDSEGQPSCSPNYDISANQHSLPSEIIKSPIQSDANLIKDLQQSFTNTSIGTFTNNFGNTSPSYLSTPEVNYNTVSSDKPPKERLKLIIKTDVIRNALAAAAAAAVSTISSDKTDKKSKNKKHKNVKLTAATEIQFKTPSPQQSGGDNFETYRTVTSPPDISEKDFDSQSSILGSVSSKSVNIPNPQVISDDACVIRSHGSSDITSDIETSQHSSLVAPPSDIELRLESMMEGDSDIPIDSNANQSGEPLKEDILDILTGVTTEPEQVTVVGDDKKDEHVENEVSAKRVTRGRRAKVEPAPLTPKPTRRNRKIGVAPCQESKAENPANNEEVPLLTVNEPLQESPTRRSSRRNAMATTIDQDSPVKKASTKSTAKLNENIEVETKNEEPVKLKATKKNASPKKVVKETFSVNDKDVLLPDAVPKRAGRNTRLNNNNNNKSPPLDISVVECENEKTSDESKSMINVTPPIVRSYSRKRKIPVTPPEQEMPFKQSSIGETSSIDLPNSAINLPSLHSIDLPNESISVPPITLQNVDTGITLDHEPSANTNIPPAREYKIKNKFKRTWLERDAKEQEEAAAAQAHQQAVEPKNDGLVDDTNYGIQGETLEQNNVETEETGRVRATPPPEAFDETQKDRSGVKLVISKKKGSIFKSRALVNHQNDDASKKRHVYKHRWDAEDELNDKVASKPKENDQNNQRTIADKIFDDFNGDDDDDDDDDVDVEQNRIPEKSVMPKLTRFNKQIVGKFETEQITSVRCDRSAKEFYTVVRNVKTAHQIQEIGEYQEMDDDIEYILDALQPHNPISTRCLSALKLATKCMTPAFRMHVRAHGTVAKFFKALQDAKNDLSLGLCTATIMFVLSQDMLNMDLDRDSLELMMNLLEADACSPLDLTNFDRNKLKVREICEEIKNQGKATHLNIDSISVGTLAMETLLSLTSKRAGEWFKEELRELGGLEHILKTVCECFRQISDYVVSWTDSLLDKLKTIERCLRVLENVTQLNDRNQNYILMYDNGQAVNTIFKLYKLCDSEIALYPTTDSTPKNSPGVVLREALVPTLKVLINLTHPFDCSAEGSNIIGAHEGIFDTSFHILLQITYYVPDKCIFEISMLVLLLLINLTMYTISNREKVMQSHAPSDYGSQFDKVPAIKALIEYFHKCEEHARMAEKNTDAILENTDNKKKQEEVDETVNNLLQKAGHHMDYTLKASYAGILIGHLITDNKENEKIIRSYLHDNKFKEVVNMLQKYYTFMSLTASSEATVVAHIKSTKKIIDQFTECDKEHSNVENNDDTNNFDRSESPTTTSTVRRLNPPRVYKTYSQR